MTERGFDTAFWNDGFVQDLDVRAKLLHVYLWTNDHCNQAGLYEITINTMSAETGIDKTMVPEMLGSLHKKIEWYSDLNIVWVKNFVKRQSKSPKFLAAVAKSLLSIPYPQLVTNLLTYNVTRYSISIPYQYYIDTHARAATATALVSSGSVEITGKEVLGEKPLGEHEESGKIAELTALYEGNFGQITPLIAENLKDMCRQYPLEWFKPAFAEACAAQVRKLNYVSRILERWRLEGYRSSRKGGKNIGEDRGHPQETTAERIRASLGKPLD